VTEVFLQKTDWGRLLDELRDAGYTGYAVAKAMGRNWDTVQGWREHEPKHSDGEALKALHAKYCLKVGFG
jgi:nitrogen regulatory protein PII-like uncharacterized protein